MPNFEALTGVSLTPEEKKETEIKAVENAKQIEQDRTDYSVAESQPWYESLSKGAQAGTESFIGWGKTQLADFANNPANYQTVGMGYGQHMIPQDIQQHKAKVIDETKKEIVPQIQKSAEVNYDKVKELSKGQHGFAFETGQMLPQVGQMLGVMGAHVYAPEYALLADAAYLGGMTVTSSGGAIHEFEEYKKSIGEDPNDPKYDGQKSLIGMGGAIFEVGAEGILGGITRYMPGASKGLVSGLVNKMIKKDGGQAVSNALRRFASEQPDMWGKLMRSAGKTGDQLIGEGIEEDVTESANMVMEFVYRETKDNPDMKEIWEREVGAFKGGVMMAGMLNGPSHLAQNYVTNRMRDSRGVHLAGVGDEVFEITHVEEKTFDEKTDQHLAQPEYVVHGIKADGTEVSFKPEQIENQATLTHDEFKEYVKGMKKGQEMKAMEEVAQLRNQSTGRIEMALSINQREDEMPFYIMNEHPDGTVVIMDAETGARRMIKASEINSETRQVIDDQQILQSMTPQEAEVETTNPAPDATQLAPMQSQYQVGQTVQINGMAGVVSDMSSDGRMVVETQQGSIEATADQLKPVQTLTDGKEQYAGIEKEDGSLSVGDAMYDQNKAQKKAEQLNTLYQGKRTFEVQSNPSGDVNTPDTYQIVSREVTAEPEQQAEVQPQAIQQAETGAELPPPPNVVNDGNGNITPVEAQEANTTPGYAHKGQSVSKSYIKGLIRTADSKEDLEGVQIENDDELLGMVEAKFPTPKQAYTYDGEVIDRDEAMGIIAGAKKPEHLAGLNIENDEELQQSAQAKFAPVAEIAPIEATNENLPQQEEAPVAEAKPQHAGEFLDNHTTNKEISQAETNVHTEPTDAQKEAGNYRKGHVNIQGLDITIENPKGSKRAGTDTKGNKWEVTMNNTYGYFKRTMGKDGDQVDVFMGDKPNSKKVFVVDQVNENGEFDEHKVMMGFDTKEEAAENYNKNYSEGWTGLGNITEMGIDEFKVWLKDGERTTQPAASQETEDTKPVLKGVYRTPRKAEFKGNSRRGKLANAEPLSLKHAILNYFISGGKVTSEFFKRELSKAPGEVSPRLGLFNNTTGVNAADVMQEQMKGQTHFADVQESEFIETLHEVLWGHKSVGSMMNEAEGIIGKQSNQEELNADEQRAVAEREWMEQEEFEAQKISDEKAILYIEQENTYNEIRAYEQSNNGTAQAGSPHQNRDGKNIESQARPDTGGDTGIDGSIHGRGVARDQASESTSGNATGNDGKLREDVRTAGEFIDGRIKEKEAVIPVKQLEAIISQSPTKDREAFENETLKDFAHLIKPNESITARELAERVRTSFDQNNPKNKVAYSTLFHMGDVMLEGKANGVYKNGRHKGNHIEATRKETTQNEELNENQVNEKKQRYETKEGKTIQYQLAFDYDNRERNDQLQQGKNRDNNPSLRQLKAGERSAVELKYTADKNFIFNGKNKIESTDDVAYLFRQLETKAVENLFACLVDENGKGTVIHISMGGRAGTVSELATLADAIHRMQPSKVYLIHNHPSGNLAHSNADVKTHRAAIDAFGDVMGEHVILNTTSGQYATFKFGLDHEIKDRPTQMNDEVRDYRVIKMDKQIYRSNTKLGKITDSSAVANFLTAQRFSDGGKISVLVLAQNNSINAYIHTPFTELTDENKDGIVKELQAYGGRFGGRAMVLATNAPLTAKEIEVLKAVNRTLKESGFDILDVVSITNGINYSASNEGILEPEESYKKNSQGTEGVLFKKDQNQSHLTDKEVETRKALIEKTVSEFNEKVQNASKTVVVGRQSDLSDAMQGEKNKIREDVLNETGIIGAYYSPGTDTVYLVAENMPDTREGIFEVYAHEQLLHKGLRMLIPNRAQRQIFLKQIFDVVGNDVIMEEIGDGYKLAPDSVKAEEYLAKIAEKVMQEQDLTPKEKTTWDNFIERINDLILQVFGRKVNLTVEDLHTLIRASAQEVIGYVEIQGNTRSDIHSEERTPSQVSNPSRLDVSGREDGRIGSTASTQSDLSGVEGLSDQGRGQVEFAGDRIGNNRHRNAFGIHQKEVANQLKQAISNHIEIIPLHHGTAQEFEFFDDKYMGGATNEKANGEGHYFGTTWAEVKRYAGKAAAHAGLYDAYTEGMAQQLGTNAAQYFKERMEDQGVEEKLKQKLKAHKQTVYSQEEVDAVVEYVANNPLPAVRIHLNTIAFKNKNIGAFNHLQWKEPLSENQRTAIIEASKGLAEGAEITDLINNPDTTGQDVVKKLGGFFNKGSLLEEGIFKGENSEQKTRELLENAGIDGVHIPKGEDSEGMPAAYMTFFDRDQLAIEEVGYFKLNSVPGKTATEDIYFSPTERALDNIKQEKATSQQWKAMLMKNGAKEAEMEWSGLNELLSADKSFTKQELYDTLEANKIELEEVVLSDEEFNNKQALKEDQAKWEQLDEKVQQAYIQGKSQEEIEQAEADRDNWQDEMRKKKYPEKETKFSQYSTIGGKNYKEWLLTLPANESKKIYNKLDALKDEIISKSEDGQVYSYIRENPNSELTRKYNELNHKLIVANTKESSEGITKEDVYTSKHWSEPNVAVHIRTQEFTDKDGKRVLLLDEVQSDWAQEGKKKGYNESYKEEDITPITKDEAISRGYSESDNKFFWYFDVPGNTLQLPRSKYKTQEDAINYILRDKKKVDSGIPNMPFKQTPQWVSLAFRRMLRHAAENGFDTVAWSTGKQNADRYSLSKQVDKVYYNPKTLELGYFYTGERTPQVKTKVKSEQLESLIGKEVAKKLIDTPLNEDNTHELEGEGLEVGGEGMKSFYDQIIPSVVKKAFKATPKTSEIVVGEAVYAEAGDQVIDLRTGEMESNTGQNTESQTVTVHAIDLTPELKEKSLQPQPLFKKRWKESGASEAKTAGEALEKLIQYDNNQPNHKAVQEKANAFVEKYGHPVVVVSSTHALPSHIKGKIKRGEEPQIQGLIDTKTGIIYVVSNNVNPKMADKVMMHELIGHKGLRDTLGEQFNPVLKKIYDSMSETERRNFADTYGTNDPHLIAEEYVAHLAENYKRPDLLKNTLAKIREYFRNVLGLDYSLNDIMHMLSKAEGYYLQERPNKTEFASAESYINAIDDWDAIRAKTTSKTPTDPDVRFSKAGRPSSDLSHKGDGFIEATQDKMITVKRLEQEVADRGGKIGEFNKVARAENLMYGKVKNAIERTSKELVDPVMRSAAEIIKAKGCTLDELQKYLKAKHAPERNRVISNRLKLQGETNQSGFETVDALQIIDTFEQGLDKGLIDQVWKDINNLSRFTLDRWLKDGFISQEHYDVVSKMYQHYVPLKGYMDKDTTWDYMTRAFNNIVNPNQEAEGRQLESEDPLQNLVSMAQTAIIAGEKNRVSQHAYRLASNNSEMTDLFKVQKAWYVETDQQDAQGNYIIRETFEKPEQALFDAGKVTEKVNPKTQRIGITATQEKEHEVEVFINGQKHKVTFENPSVARALNGENVVKYEFPGFEKMAASTRWMSANLTAKNPAFIPINTIRDVAYATTAHYVKGEKGDMGRFIKNLAKAEKAMRNEQKGKGGKYVDLYKQFKENGGETGFIHSKETEELLKEVEKDIKRYSGTNSKADKVAQTALTYSTLKFWGEKMENFAIRSENLSRFATYLTALERGATPEQAAHEAKEITVNFNTKGTHAKGLGGAYAFFNASIQGGQNFMNMGLKHKGEFVKASATFMAMGFLTAMSQMAFKDDDEEKEWNNLSDYMKQNYLCVNYGKGQYISIPLPPGFRAFYGMGVMVADQTWGIKKNAVQLGLNLGSVMSGAVSPIDPVSFFKETDNGTYTVDARPIVPTIGVPLYDVWMNEDFAGRPITREPYTKVQAEQLADAGLYMKNVNGVAKWMTDRVYEMGGGDTELYRTSNIDDGHYIHLSDLTDYNPSNIEHLIESYTGGRGKFFNQLQKTTFGITESAYKAIKGEDEPMADFDSNDIPILSRLNRRTPGANFQKIYYHLKEEVAKYKELKKACEDNGEYKVDNEMERKIFILEMMDKDMKDIKKLDKETLNDPGMARRNKEIKDKILKPYIKMIR